MPPEDDQDLESQLQNDGPTGSSGPEDTGLEGKEVPENFSGLSDLIREQEPRMKDVDALPRDKDGKFLPANSPEGDASGATAAPTGSSGAVAASGATAAPTGPAGATGPTAPTGRDADLDTSKLDPHMRAPTRKVIEGYAAKAKEARDRADAAQTELQTLKTQVAELEGKVKTVKAPKEMEDELTSLRARVRELDISKDPALQNKYDKPIETNANSAMELLKEHGIFQIAQKEGAPKEMTESEKQALTAQLKRDGFGIRGMAKFISALSQQGLHEAAERLRYLASDTDSLGRAREQEITKWNQDYEGLQAQRARESQSAQEAYVNTTRTTGQTELQNSLAALAKDFPFLNPPAAVQPGDTADVKATKEKALAEFNAASEAVKEGAKQFSTEGLAPEKAAVVHGKLQASAIESIVIKQSILPRLKKDLAAAEARVKELEERETKQRKATSINRAHAAAVTAPENKGRAPDKSLSMEDAMKQIASENGIDVST